MLTEEKMYPVQQRNVKSDSLPGLFVNGNNWCPV
jgi:hypothetical protein